MKTTTVSLTTNMVEKRLMTLNSLESETTGTVEIAQRLTSRIGKKRLMLLLGAITMCFQTARASQPLGQEVEGPPNRLNRMVSGADGLKEGRDALRKDNDNRSQTWDSNPEGTEKSGRSPSSRSQSGDTGRTASADVLQSSERKDSKGVEERLGWAQKTYLKFKESTFGEICSNCNDTKKQKYSYDKNDWIPSDADYTPKETQTPKERDCQHCGEIYDATRTDMNKTQAIALGVASTFLIAGGAATGIQIGEAIQNGSKNAVNEIQSLNDGAFYTAIVFGAIAILFLAIFLLWTNGKRLNAGMMATGLGAFVGIGASVALGIVAMNYSENIMKTVDSDGIKGTEDYIEAVYEGKDETYAVLTFAFIFLFIGLVCLAWNLEKRFGWNMVRGTISVVAVAGMTGITFGGMNILQEAVHDTHLVEGEVSQFGPGPGALVGISVAMFIVFACLYYAIMGSDPRNIWKQQHGGHAKIGAALMAGSAAMLTLGFGVSGVYASDKAVNSSEIVKQDDLGTFFDSGYAVPLYLGLILLLAGIGFLLVAKCKAKVANE